MSSRHALVLSLVAWLTVLAGCVQPGEMPDRALVRYQQAMAERAARTSDATSGSLVPAETGPMPRLEVDSLVERVIRFPV